IKSKEESSGRRNCALILTTNGGDPDAAYIMVRFLKRTYENLTLYVFGYCKSAGTLLALGADEIVMGAFGELGPLDVQLSKKDEIGLRNSGLDIFMALNVVSTQAFYIFEQHFLELKRRSQGAITTKTAAHIATTVAARLLQPITAQIDPLRLGEMQRAVTIAKQYGERLGASSDSVDRLIYEYPSTAVQLYLHE
ncbi:MAG TPA: SppA protein, partial [Candidatus Polarisedimenticolia bacterium]|nr:SppA protein [Candidatus Polarisedimenticolia bacterium]